MGLEYSSEPSLGFKFRGGGLIQVLLEEDIFGSTKKSTFTYILLQKPGGLIIVQKNYRGAKALPAPPLTRPLIV